MNEIAFCITGWHYPLDYYQEISSLPGVDIYIVSHKKRRNIPGFLFELFPENQILLRSNIGYDWGCYQQFISSGLWRRYSTLFFMHDDIDIHDFGFVEETRKLLGNHAVIGNGRGQGSVSYTSVRNHPYAYAHSSWKPDSFDFQHYTIRGSFLATTRNVLEKLDTFEVYWDPFKIFIGYGNWSTKATCGKMADTFGPNCFGYLSEVFGSSKYITEYVRGKAGGELNQPGDVNKSIYSLIKRLSQVYIETYYREREVKARSLWLLAMKPILRLFSGKLY
ncbi:MAG: hypothetical protein KAS84_03535 [Anaerolineales bacterium]|nr:hypothetical protein [Anaerolineales bacterium]